MFIFSRNLKIIFLFFSQLFVSFSFLFSLGLTVDTRGLQDILEANNSSIPNIRSEDLSTHADSVATRLSEQAHSVALFELAPLRGATKPTLSLTDKKKEDIKFKFPPHSGINGFAKDNGLQYITRLIDLNHDNSAFSAMFLEGGNFYDGVSVHFTFQIDMGNGKILDIAKSIDVRTTHGEIEALFKTLTLAKQQTLTARVSMTSNNLVSLLDKIVSGDGPTQGRPSPVVSPQKNAAPVVTPRGTPAAASPFQPVSPGSPLSPVSPSAPVIPQDDSQALQAAPSYARISGIVTIINNFVTRVSKLNFFQKHFSIKRKIQLVDQTNIVAIGGNDAGHSFNFADIFFKNAKVRSATDSNIFTDMSIGTLFYLYLLASNSADGGHTFEVKERLLGTSQLMIFPQIDLAVDQITVLLYKSLRQKATGKKTQKEIRMIIREVLLRDNKPSFFKKLFLRIFSFKIRKETNILFNKLFPPEFIKNDGKESVTMATSSEKVPIVFNDSKLKDFFNESENHFSRISKEMWGKWGLNNSIPPSSIEFEVKDSVPTQSSPLLSNQRHLDGTLEITLVRQTGALTEKTLSFWMLHERIQDSFKQQYLQSKNKKHGELLTKEENASLEIVSLIALRNYIIDGMGEGEFWRNQFTQEMVKYLESVYQGASPQKLLQLDALLVVLGKEEYSSSLNTLSLKDAISSDSKINIFEQLNNLNIFSQDDQKALTVENIMELRKYA